MTKRERGVAVNAAIIAELFGNGGKGPMRASEPTELQRYRLGYGAAGSVRRAYRPGNASALLQAESDRLARLWNAGG